MTAPHGSVARGFEPIAEVFAETLNRARGGAAFAACVDGEPVVDLSGGWADEASERHWADDTIQLVFSGTKGLVATCLLVLLDRGLIDLDAPVTRYWPEFAGGGKERLLVRHVVSHTAGLPGLDRVFEWRDLLDGDARAVELAGQRPLWEPGTRLAYHALTYGWLCGELVRRVDGRTLGRFFAEEIAEPLGLGLWIGLPPELEPRVATLYRSADFAISYYGDEPEPLLAKVYGALLNDGERWNDPALHRAEIPAANAIGTARSIARLYACLARGGELDGVRLVRSETTRIGATELARATCAITRRPYAYGVGFELQTELAPFGPPRDAFGHTGSGGSAHGAWPTERVGFSYAMTELRPEASDDRARRLLAALHDAVRGAGSG